MDFDKVKCSENGGCNCCDKSVYYDDDWNPIYKQEEIVTILFGRMRIRICDECLDKLKNKILEYQQ